MMMMVLVSKQHKVTTKYKMQAKTAFLPYLSVGRRHYPINNAGQVVGFAAGQVHFQVTCPAGRVRKCCKSHFSQLIIEEN